MPSPARVVLATLAVLTLGAAPTLAQSGDTGQAPTTGAECRAFLKSVDADIAWEFDRYAKVKGKLVARRAELRRAAATIVTAQAGRQARMDVLMAALEDQDNPPSEEDGAAMVDEYNALAQAFEAARIRLNGLRDRIEGRTWELGEALKLHKSNLRNARKYRAQIAAYCERF